MSDKRIWSDEDLDLFEMGGLAPEDAAELRRELAASDELCARLAARSAEASLLGYALRSEQSAPENRHALLRALSANDVRTQREAPRPAPLARDRWRWPALAFAFAAAVFLLISAGLLIQNRAFRQANSDQSAQLALQEQRLQKIQSQAQQASAILATMQAADSAHFVLTAAGAQPQPQIKTYYQRSTGQVVLVASHLPPVAPGKTYELWLVPSSGGAPLAAGLFRPDSHGNVSAEMTQAPPGTGAKVFAVTLEPEGGSPVGTPPILFSGAQGD